jgi:hypothetical protein
MFVTFSSSRTRKAPAATTVPASAAAVEAPTKTTAATKSVP